MPFKILPDTLLDAECIGEIRFQCQLSTRNKLEIENCKKEDLLDLIIKIVRAEIETCVRNPSEVMTLKCVDFKKGKEGEKDEGTVAGYALWGATSLLCAAKSHISLPAGTDMKLCTSFHDGMRDLENQHKPKWQHCKLTNLLTPPHYQRRGIARLLVEYGLKKADENNMAVYLNGFPMRVGLYRALGFVEVGKW